MMRALLQVLLNGVALLVASKIVPGISYQGGFLYLLLAGLIFGLVNLIVKPITTLLSLPFIILTLGLFFLIINALMLKLTAVLLNGFSVQGFLPAILGGVVIAVFNWAISALVKD
ncbi:MAG: phage holin family protein [Acidobacteriota bacterium]